MDRRTERTGPARDELTVLRQRLHRISGQVLAVDRMIAEERPSEELLIQLAAVRGGLRAVGLQLLSRHIRGCDRVPDPATADEIAALARLLVDV